MGLLRAAAPIAVPLLMACGAGAAPRSTRPVPVLVSPKALGKPAPAADVPAPTEPAVAAPEAPPEPVDPDILAVVGRHWRVDGWTLVPLLQFDAGDRALVIVWPAFDPKGELTRRKDCVGFVVAREPDRERPLILGAPFDATAITPDDVVKRLGTST